MSRSASARRLGLRKKGAPISLFPFLAVLICTMGALIVLLVVLVQQAKVHAAHVAEEHRHAAAQAEHSAEEQRLERESYEWRLEILDQQKQEIAQKLAGERLRLSHVEDHHRRLKEELQGLLHQAAEMERVIQGGAHDAAAAQAELVRLREAIEVTRAQADQAQRQAQAEPQSFALIPYQGPRGTRRRPIYIECLRDRIVLQPEGITLVDRDFEGPLGPGNPLDAALRATREHLARTGGVERHGEPYPLLVVRSQGARSYAAARSALEAWDDEFGYELIDDDLTLAYAAPDPLLQKAMQAAVDEARRRQEIVRAAQPNRYRENAVAGFQATARHGGFRAVSEGGASDEGGEIAGVGARGGRPGFDGSAGHSDAFETRADGAVHHAGERVRDSAAGQNASPSGSAPSPGGDRRAGGVAGGNRNFGDTAGSSVTSLANSRGRNWGLKDAAAGATAYTRPIALQCHADKFVLVPERGLGQTAVTIPMAGATRSAIDPLMQAIWKRTDGWGLAGHRAYWRPVLKVEVAPDAEDRFTDMQQLFEGSGLVIERASP